jgi:hypothetical protein
MPPSWRAGLVNAVPIPEDRRKKKKRPTHTVTYKARPDPSSSTQPELNEEIAEPFDPFPFLLLPPEIRSKIYLLALFPPPPSPTNPRGPSKAAIETPATTLSLLRASQLIHAETTHLLYTQTAFPLFPIQTFPPLPTPLNIPVRHRPLLKHLTLRIGNSWSSPPKSWRVSKLLARALPKFTSLTTLRVFVEVDPSEPFFEKYRISKSFYTDFAGDLLRDVLAVLTQVTTVEVGGNEGVKVRGPLVSRVVEVARECERDVKWSEEGAFRNRIEMVVADGQESETSLNSDTDTDSESESVVWPDQI